YLDGCTFTILLLMVVSVTSTVPEEISQSEPASELESADIQGDTVETDAVYASDDESPTEEEVQEVNPEELPTPEELFNRRRKGRPNGRVNVRPMPLLRVGPIRGGEVNSRPVFTTGLGRRLPPNRAPSMKPGPTTLPGPKRTPSVKPPEALPHDIYTSSLNNIQQEKIPEAMATEEDEQQLRR
ncbi:unnamed protein product, partial [Meganyctiphanes norvegica]